MKLRNILIDLIKEHLLLGDMRHTLELETYTLRQLISICDIYNIDINEFKELEKFYELNNI